MDERARWIEEQVDELTPTLDETFVRQLLNDAMSVADRQRELTWTTEKPTQAGWYWFRNVKRQDYKEPQIVYLRDYAGEIAIGNSTLKGFTLFEEGEWAGPLLEPKE